MRAIHIFCFVKIRNRRGTKKVKLALISDTHGFYNIELADSLYTRKIDYIFHMGDGVEDAYELRDTLHLPLFTVLGNNDYGFDERFELFLTLGGKRIFMTHGHRYGVYYGRERLFEAAIQKNAELVLYGHTHIFKDEFISGIRFINPGSASFPRGGDVRSYGILDLESGEFERIIL